jgi:hypothetical protein
MVVTFNEDENTYIDIEHVNDITIYQSSLIWWTDSEMKQSKSENMYVVNRMNNGTVDSSLCTRGLEYRATNARKKRLATIRDCVHSVCEEYFRQKMTGSNDCQAICSKSQAASRKSREAAQQRGALDAEDAGIKFNNKTTSSGEMHSDSLMYPLQKLKSLTSLTSILEQGPDGPAPTRSRRSSPIAPNRTIAHVA